MTLSRRKQWLWRPPEMGISRTVLQRIVGKTEGRKRLVHFSFKMAANMAAKLHRPFHSAFSQGLLSCPHQRYIGNCSFYTKDGPWMILFGNVAPSA